MKNSILLKNKNFNMILSSRLLINMADSLLYMLVVWYLSEESATLTSIAVFCFTLAEAVVIFFGPIIDRYSHKQILFISAVLQIILIAGLSVFLDFEILSYPILLAVIFILAVLGSISYETEETIIPNIVEQKNLVQANSIMEIAYSIMDSIFNGISGWLIFAFSMSFLYKIDVLLYTLPLLFIICLKLPKKEINEEADAEDSYSLKAYKDDLIGGLKILWSNKIRKLILPLILINLFFAMRTVAMPFFSRGIKDNAIVFGSLLTINGIGAFVGAFLSNIINKKFSLQKGLTIAFFLQGVTWILAMSFSNFTIVVFIMCFISAMFFGAGNVLFESLFQSIVPREFLGRANTAITTLITSAMPIGIFIAGLMLEMNISPALVMLPYGIISTLACFYYWINLEYYK